MERKVSSKQMIMLIVVTRIANGITFMPMISMGPANQDIWIMIIVSFFYTILSASPLLFLSNKFNDLTIIGVMEKIFGRALGRLVGVLYTLFFISISILFSYIAIQMISSTLLTDTSLIIIIFVLISSCIYIASNGLNPIVRSMETLGPIIIVSFGIFIFLGISSMDPSILLPIYKDSTFLSLNIGAIQMSSIFTDIYMLTMIIPKLENKEEINKIFIKSIFYSGLLMIAMVVATQSSLGIEQAKHSNFPFLTFVKQVKSYSIFQRIESLYIIIWMFAIISRISNYIYISSQALKESLKLKGKNISLYIVGITTMSITYYVTESKIKMDLVMDILVEEYILFITFKILIPILTIIVYLFRRKSLENQRTLGN